MAGQPIANKTVDRLRKGLEIIANPSILPTDPAIWEEHRRLKAEGKQRALDIALNTPSEVERVNRNLTRMEAQRSPLARGCSTIAITGAGSHLYRTMVD